MKKIVFVTQNMAPFRMKWLDALSTEYEIVVYHLNEYDNTMDKRFISYFPKTIVVKNSFYKLCGHKYFKAHEIFHEKADIIFLDGYGFTGQILLIAQLRIFRKKFLMNVDGGFIRKNEKPIIRFIKYFCLNSPYSFFSSSEITDKYIKYYSNGKKSIYRHLFSSFYSCDIVYQTDEERENRRRRLDMSERFVIISVGRFIPVKGFDILIQAANILDSNICFYFIGGEPKEEYLSMIKDHSKVKFVGFLNRKELQEYYLASDVYVTASRGDVWGLTVGEAMACGLPVITSDKCIAGASMVINGQNGFVVCDENPESYADYIKKLIIDINLRKKMSKNNYLLAQKYALDTAVKQDIINLNNYINDI